MRSVFLLVGHSNMAGRGNLAELSSADRAMPQIEMFFRGQWQPYQEPLQDMDDPVYSRPADRLGGVGPAIGFGRELAARGEGNVGLLMCARGSTRLIAWDRSGDLYTAMLERTKQACRVGRLSGMLVYVGESETRSHEAAEQWRPQFETLVANVRQDMQSPRLPVVFAQIATITPERRVSRDHNHVAWERLKDLQAAFSMDNVAMVKTDDLPLNDDGLHLSAVAQVRLGHRFGTTMAKLLAGETPSLSH